MWHKSILRRTTRLPITCAEVIIPIIDELFAILRRMDTGYLASFHVDREIAAAMLGESAILSGTHIRHIEGIQQMWKVLPLTRDEL